MNDPLAWVGENPRRTLIAYLVADSWWKVRLSDPENHTEASGYGVTPDEAAADALRKVLGQPEATVLQPKKGIGAA